MASARQERNRRKVKLQGIEYIYTLNDLHSLCDPCHHCKKLPVLSLVDYDKAHLKCPSNFCTNISSNEPVLYKTILDWNINQRQHATKLIFDNINNYIKLQDCKHGYLYDVISKYFKKAIFDSENNNFLGLSCNHNELLSEYHIDCTNTYATVYPIKELEDSKLDLTNSHKFVMTDSTFRILNYNERCQRDYIIDYLLLKELMSANSLN